MPKVIRPTPKDEKPPEPLTIQRQRVTAINREVATLEEIARAFRKNPNVCTHHEALMEKHERVLELIGEEYKNYANEMKVIKEKLIEINGRLSRLESNTQPKKGWIRG